MPAPKALLVLAESRTMLSLPRHKVNWKLSVFTLFFALLTLYLGYWQLQRAAQKREILAHYERMKRRDPVDIDLVLEPMQADQPYRKIRAQGHFDAERYWLLEGRIHEGRVGYEVLMPFVLDERRAIIVNRGWVAAAGDRQRLPPFFTPLGQVTLHGEWRPPSDSPLINERKNPLRRWPHAILEVDLPLMREQWGASLQAALVQLEASDPHAFTILGTPVNMPPSRHQAYALQWFLMSFVVLSLYAFTVYKTTKT